MLIELDGRLPEGLTAFESYQVYNCLDSAVTAQLLPQMKPLLNENTARTYNREMRMVGLCLSMSITGMPIDHFALLELIHALQQDQDKALTVLARFCEAVEVPTFNPNSPLQVANFFYGTMGIPEIRKYDFKKKVQVVDTSREAMEKLYEGYPSAKPFVNCVLAYKDATKLLGVFKRGLEADGRLRCSFSPTGTDTGRLSSSQNVYQRGTNAQNLNDRSRRPISAAKGHILSYHDLKTAESIAVGFLSRCTKYIEGCMSGDLHTYVARLIWPNLPWTGELKKDKKIAEQKFYRDFSYRDIAKRGGHGTNYLGQPRQIGRILKVAPRVIEIFQEIYFDTFPEIQTWQTATIAQVQTTGRYVSPMGRERRFWGHPNDAATHRAAVASAPQGLVADVMNEGLLQGKRWLLDNEPRGQLLAQVHDAGLFHLPINTASNVMGELNERLVFPVDFGDLGVMRIPVDAQWGYNWAKHKPGKNNGGLRDWNPQELIS